MIRNLATILLAVCLAMPAAASEIDLSKAINIGSGPKTVIEFTDPDCPYCRKASKYFGERSDVTRHIFFLPLPRHPKAKEKAQYVLSQPDKVRAYREIMGGKLDAVPFLDIATKGVKLQEEHAEIAKKAKVNSTPTFMINGRIIVGFDLQKIEEALGR